MSVKKLFQLALLDRFAERLPSYRHDSKARTNTAFRHARPDGIFRHIAVQLDVPGHAFHPVIATTYASYWEGQSTMPIGKDAYFTDLMETEELSEKGTGWITFESTPAGVRASVDSMIDDFLRLSPQFFESAEITLLNSTLLQVALRLAAEIPASEREGLDASLRDARFLVADVDHPEFVRLRNKLRDSWGEDTTAFEREATNRIAYDCLALVPPRHE